MTVRDIEVRGWKEICGFLIMSKPTAKKKLKKMKLLCYDDGVPVLNIEAYRIASLERHNGEGEKVKAFPVKK